MQLTLKEKLSLYKDFKRLYEQLVNFTLTLELINANIDNNKEIEICIERIESISIGQLNIIKEILIDKLNIKDKLSKNVLYKITIDDIISL